MEEKTNSYSSMSLKTGVTEQMFISGESNTSSDTTNSTTVAMATSQMNVTDEEMLTVGNRNDNENLATQTWEDDNINNRERHVMVK